MFDPMIARLAGCLVFGGLLGSLVVAVDAPPSPGRPDVVAAAEIQHRVQDTLITRP